MPTAPGPTAPGPAAPGQAGTTGRLGAPGARTGGTGAARLSSVDRRPPDGVGAEPDDAEKATGKKKKKLVVILAIVAVLVVAGAVVKLKMDKTVYRPGEPVPAGQVVSLGTVTVALSDGHLVQATIDLQMTKPASLTEESDDSAHLEDVAVSVLGGQSYTALLVSAGRTAVQQQLLTSFQQVLGRSDGAEQVSAVYFTGFVLQ
jgi:flagellar basal body-associated protein FliL